MDEADADDVTSLHWRNFIYKHTARHWHALWCRWSPTGDLRTSFHAERIFTPTETRDGANMHVIYHYADDRGTVSTGPPCGPWTITEAQHSCSDGMQHPASPEMTTLLLPAGPSAWCMKRSPFGTPCATELFLHHGEHLRMSAGIVHDKHGALAQLALVREDARGPWPSEDWSSSTEASSTTKAGLAEALAQAAAPTSSRGIGYAVTATLAQRAVQADWNDTRVGRADPMDAVLLCAEARVAIVGPKQRVEGEGFSSGAAWWPNADAAVLYTIEASWTAAGILDEVKYLVFAAA